MATDNKRILVLVFSFLLSPFLFGQKSISEHDGYYKKEMQSLYTAIQRNYYDTAAGFYREAVPLKNGQNMYSYLWPVCALFQAANEMEKIQPGTEFLVSFANIIRAYYDPAPPAPGYASYIMKFGGGDRFYDDNQWLGITAMDAYARNKNKAYLKFGKEIYRYMMTGFDTVLSGGLYWQENKKVSKNTCSNGPGIILALQLCRATKNKAYLDTALLLYNWVNKTLKAPSGLYWDNISVKNNRIGKVTFSYNTGTMLQSNIYLYECTGNKKYLKEATAIADSSLRFFYGNGKFRDSYWFNAVLLRGYQHLFQYNKDPKYLLGFKQCLDHALRTEKNDRGLFGKEAHLELVPQGGLLEILARFAFLERKYPNVFREK